MQFSMEEGLFVSFAFCRHFFALDLGQKLL